MVVNGKYCRASKKNQGSHHREPWPKPVKPHTKISESPLLVKLGAWRSPPSL